jgi:hypothetical protein
MKVREANKRWRAGAAATLVVLVSLTAFQPVRCSVLPRKACRFVDTFMHAPQDFDFLSKVALSLSVSNSPDRVY